MVPSSYPFPVVVKPLRVVSSWTYKLLIDRQIIDHFVIMRIWWIYQLASLLFAHLIVLKKRKKRICIFYHFSTPKSCRSLTSFLIHEAHGLSYIINTIAAVGMAMAKAIWVNISPCNGLFPDDIVGCGADQRKHQSSASLAFVRGIHRWPVNSPHKKPLTRKYFHFMTTASAQATSLYTESENYTFDITVASTRCQWVNTTCWVEPTTCRCKCTSPPLRSATWSEENDP